MTYVEQKHETQRLNTILDELERNPLPIITARCVPMSEDMLAVIERSKELENGNG